MNRRAESGAGAWQLSDQLSCLVECKFGFNTSHVRWGTFQRSIPRHWLLMAWSHGGRCSGMGTVTGSFPGTMAGYGPPHPEASASSFLSCKNSSLLSCKNSSLCARPQEISFKPTPQKKKTQVLGDYSAEGTQQGSARSHTVVPGWVSILMWTDHGETNCLLSLSVLLGRKVWVSETLGELSRLPRARLCGLCLLLPSQL